MGNINSNACFDGGYMYVKTDQPYYYPGNTVKGKIYLRLESAREFKKIEIEIKGKEKIGFRKQKFKENDDGSTEVEWEKIKEDKTHMNTKVKCKDFDGEMEAGDYEIPFEFDLPDDIPSSVIYSNKKDHEKPKCNIKYHIKCIIDAAGWFGRDLKYKQMLVVHEKPVEFKENTTKEETINISEWCCIDKGSCNMKVNFNKNIFYSNETAKAMVAVDNSKCGLPVKRVEFRIVQKVKMKGDHERMECEKEIIDKDDESGIPAGGTEVTTKEMELDLSKIKYAPSKEKKKKGKMKARSPEEYFMLTQLPPAVHSKYCDLDYKLNMNVEFDGCVCGEKPSISVPLTIIPLTDPETYGFTVPEGWNPTELCYIKIENVKSK